MKIFVSYSRRDAGDFASQIQMHLSSFNYDVFTDVNSIMAGEIWSNTIETNISNCDIFVVIVTDGALHSPHVEREVLQAQRENKKIIPCFHKDIIESDIKWGLDKIQGVEFDDRHELARSIYSKIVHHTSRNKGRGRTFGSTSKTVEETKTHSAPITTIKSDSSKQFQHKNLKIIIIPIIAIAIIGVIVAVSYFTVTPPDTTAPVIPPDTTAPVTPVPSEDISQTYEFTKAWGSKGTGDGELDYPKHVAVDSDGNVYVSDGDNSRIQKFDSNGDFITEWGSKGTEDGEFNSPDDVAVDSDGNVYVADSENHRIQKFDSNGDFITKWAIGNVSKEYTSYGIGIDSGNNVYVVDGDSMQGVDSDIIQKFDSNGDFITKWDTLESERSYTGPRSIAIDSIGNIYVLMADGIDKFNSNGDFITGWGYGSFSFPDDIAVDSEGNVYVVDTNNHRVQKFDSNGNFITKWGSEGSGDGEFKDPGGIAVDSNTNIVYVADSYNDRIQVFAPTK